MFGQMNIFLSIFVIFLRGIDLCSPPRSKFGEQSIKQQTLLKRADEAEIIVLGSVVETYPDKYGSSLTIRVAVHMVLKSQTKVKKYIKISGFDEHSKSKKQKLFHSQASLDCVTTVVQLYGSYIFFIRENQYGDFYVHEINFQSAVTEIPCKQQLSKRVKRLIIKYRKEKKNRPQCNDFALSKSSFSRKCLKHRSFSRYLNEFKYKMLPIRKFFCSVRRSATNTIKKVAAGPSEPTMRDVVRPRGKNKNKNKLREEEEEDNDEDDNAILQSSNKNKRPKIIMYSKSENYILRDDLMTSSSNSDSSTGGGHGGTIEIPDWRYYYRQNHKQNDGDKTSSSNYVNVNASLLLLTTVLSYLIHVYL